MAYGDPPYPGQAHRHYRMDPSGIPAAEVDHKELIERLLRDYDGWALSTNVPGLEHIKDLFPKGFFKQNGIRIGAWVKPFAAWKPTNRVQYAWEPVLFKPVRPRGGRDVLSTRDWVSANITLRKGTHGAKPEAFCIWILGILGWQPGDILDDLYPGTGAMQAAIDKYWNENVGTS